ncbi:MAG: AmmeMemoRadiSam system radical SAM enzyme [Myxococcota bacterium]
MRWTAKRFPEANFSTIAGERIVCSLCPRYCRLKEGQIGYCGVRGVSGGKLLSLAYGRPTGFAIDPMEKKPLYHFLPGAPILSLGTLGCNMGCKFCQNHHSSKRKGTDFHLTTEATPEEVVALAKSRNVPAIAFTYNEPIIWAEYMMDIASLAKREEIRTVAVTAGYVTESAREKVFADIEAANVDLKAFTEEFYRKFAAAKLKLVLDTLRWMRNKTSIWLEVTNLVIPTLNDDESELKELCKFIRDELGDFTPLHFSAFHPAYEMMNYQATPPKTLEKAYGIAKSEGLKYVYIGNVHTEGGKDTACPSCKKRVIEREWFRVIKLKVKDGKCEFCGGKIEGVFAK